jgi:hypothetical protein
MPYQPEQEQDPLNNEERRLYEQLTICNDIKLTVNSLGWKNIIGPLIDRMIIDIVGGKIGDTWVSGKIDKAKKEERREFYVGYKQALIDLHGRVMDHLLHIPRIEDRLKAIEEEKKAKFRVPMVDDTRYNLEE